MAAFQNSLYWILLQTGLSSLPKPLLSTHWASESEYQWQYGNKRAEMIFIIHEQFIDLSAPTSRIITCFNVDFGEIWLPLYKSSISQGFQFLLRPTGRLQRQIWCQLGRVESMKYLSIYPKDITRLLQLLLIKYKMFHEIPSYQIIAMFPVQWELMLMWNRLIKATEDNR